MSAWPCELWISQIWKHVYDVCERVSAKVYFQMNFDLLKTDYRCFEEHVVQIEGWSIKCKFEKLSHRYTAELAWGNVVS